MNMLPCILQTWVLVILFSPTLFAASDSRVDLYSSARKRHLREKHDELKPLTKIFTYSLSELGNPKCSIRVLGGLVSAHILATDSANRLVQGSYKNQRFGTSFNTPTGLPYAWKKFGVLPERYLLDHQIIHPTEKYYPLRPEFAESSFDIYQATKDPWYIEVGESIVNSLSSYTKVEGGFASVRDVQISLAFWIP